MAPPRAAAPEAQQRAPVTREMTGRDLDSMYITVVVAIVLVEGGDDDHDGDCILLFLVFTKGMSERSGFLHGTSHKEQECLCVCVQVQVQLQSICTVSQCSRAGGREGVCFMIT